MAANKRTIVGAPLTPERLDELGVLRAMSPVHVSPEGPWTDHYRILACHGYRESGNETVGTLKIRRIPSQAKSSFMLHVAQEIRVDEGMVHLLDAEIECQADALATPIQWHTQSTFRDPKGAIIRDLGTERTGRVKGNTIEIETQGQVRRLKPAGPFTGDWCLLEAVQRMGYTDSARMTMEVLKEMDLLQSGHGIAYKGRNTVTMGGAPMVLHHFQQWGRGMLPYDYWLDEHHRLQIVVTLSIAYIRDAAPEQTSN